MKVDVVIVKTCTSDPRVDGGGHAFGQSEEIHEIRRPFDIECVTADVRDLSDIRSNGNVAAAAVAMPFALYRPIHRRESTDSITEIPWGIVATKCHESQFSGCGASIAIVDTGIDAEHAAFERLLSRTSDALVQEDFTGEGNGDSDGHGTHCAAIAFGGNVAGRRIGIASDIDRALVAKVFGTTAPSTNCIVRAIDWAVRQGANIISMSLGVDFKTYYESLLARNVESANALSLTLTGYRDTVQLFATVVQKALLTVNWPVIFVAAGGNANRFEEGVLINVEPPASADGVISVGALERSGTGFGVASFSNCGTRMVAPGTDIISARAGELTGLVSMSGTSMATPHVAGVAALWLEKLQDELHSMPSSRLLHDQVIGSGSRAQLNRQRLSDAGTGLVQAP